MVMERRALTSPLEVRADSGARTIAGYAAVFNSPTDIGGEWREVVAPGAFNASMSGDVRALVDHDSGRVIGRTTAGTLRMKEDEHGLAVEIDLPDTTDGNDLATLIKRGDISGMSFGFVVTSQEWDETVSPPTRTIRSVNLHEVSVVAFPAYPDTSIGLRSREAAQEEARKARAEHNRKQAEARIAERKAASEQKFRKIG